MKNTKIHKEMEKRIKKYLKIASASTLIWAATSCAHMPRSYSVIEQRLPGYFVVEKDLGKVGNMPALDAYIALKTGLINSIDLDGKKMFLYDIELEKRLRELPQNQVDSLTSIVSYFGNSKHIDREKLYREVIKELNHQSHPQPEETTPIK